MRGSTSTAAATNTSTAAAAATNFFMRGSDPGAGVHEHALPGRILAPTRRVPAHLNRAMYAFGMRHQQGTAAVAAGKAGDTQRRTVGVGRIARGDATVGLDIAHCNMRLSGVLRRVEVRAAFTVRDRDRNART